PDNVFVGAFIGSPSMNLYEAILTVTDSGGTVQIGSQTLAFGPETMSARPGLKNYDGTSIILGIRPEDFEDAAMVEHDTSGKQLTSTVSLIEALGSELMVHFDIDARTVDSGDPDAVEDSDATSNAVGRFHPRSKARMREQITIAVATENMHFFDAQTRRAIWD
ncbi:MAG: ABC transporter ATP-binding protein, partial [Actinomycetota bacterium]